MEQIAIQKAFASGLHKATLLSEKSHHYVLRAVLAGLYLSLICFLYVSLANNLAASPFGKVIAALFFGVGLCIIVVTGAELFTSNNMYMTASTLSGRTSWKQTAHLWTICYFGNLVGATAFALMLYGAGILDALPDTHALYVSAAAKVHQSAQAIFIKGILANWIVCVAVWVSLHMKEDISRLASIILIVFIFVYLGFEHSIANMGIFTMSLFGHGTITALDAGYNLLWATLGNMVGGGFFIGAIYWFLNQEEKIKAP